VPTLVIHGINGESAGNYHLMDKESTGGRGFRCELPGNRQGIHLRKGVPPGITSLFTRIQAGKLKFRGKSFEQKQFQHQQLQILFTDNANFKKKFKYGDLFKIKNKPYPAILGTSYLSN
jgi:hypothetical protein